ADQAGITVGDQILLLNGENPTSPCSAHLWTSQLDANYADLVTTTAGGGHRNIHLPLVPVRRLLANGWSARRQGRRGSLVVAESLGDQSLMFGFRWRRESNKIVVSDIFSGSPAYSSGLEIGDKIVAINGVPLVGPGVHIRSLLPDNHPGVAHLTIVRNNSRVEMNFSNEGVSEALRHVAQRDRQDGRPRVMASVF